VAGNIVHYLDSELTTVAKLAKFQQLFNLFQENGELQDELVSQNLKKYNKLLGCVEYIESLENQGVDIAKEYPFLPPLITSVQNYITNKQSTT
jgi:hypothetical protein